MNAISHELKIVQSMLGDYKSAELSRLGENKEITFEALITAKSKNIEPYSDEIKALEKEQQALDTENPYLYWSEVENEERSWLGILGFTKRRFKYSGDISFIEVKTFHRGKLEKPEEKYYFTDRVENSTDGVFQTAYTTEFYQNAHAKVDIYIKKQEYPRS